jgi:PAS domain S-box-containing protein
MDYAEERQTLLRELQACRMKLEQQTHLLLETGRRLEEANNKPKGLCRSLFENMPDGAAFCRMLYEQGAPADFVCLDINPAFERITGLKNVVGNKAGDAIPGMRHNSEFLEICGRVAQAGVSDRFETYLESVDMWFSVAVFCPEKEHFVAFFHDITELKRSQEKIREAALFPEENPLPVMCVTVEGILLFANRSADALLSQWQCSVGGRTPQFVQRAATAVLESGFCQELEASCAGRELLFLLVPVAAHNYVNFYGRDISEQKLAESELRELNEKLEKRIAERTTELACANERLVKEVNECKRMEEKLARSEERYRTVLEDQTELICRFRADGTLTFVNEVYCRFFGKTGLQLLGNKWQPRVVPGDITMIEERLSSITPTSPVVIIENRVYSGTGEVHWMQFVNRGFFDELGRLTEMQAVGRDITEKKKLEMLLSKTTEELDSFFRNSADLFCISDYKGCFRRVNSEWEQALGYSMEEMEGKCFLHFVHPDDIPATMEILNVLARNNSAKGFINRYRNKGGGYRFIEWRSISYGELIYAVARDVTDRMKMEEILASARDELERQVEDRTASLVLTNQKLHKEIEERNRVEIELRENQKRLESLALELSFAEERERARIAGELHDEVGQRLLLSKMKLDALASSEALEIFEMHFEEIGALIHQSIQDIRSLIFQLRPPLLATAGLEAAVQWLGEEFEENFGLRIQFDDDREQKPLNYEVSSALFQSVRELLLNVAKHAGTMSVRVNMERKADAIVITVADEGVGFEVGKIEAGRTGAGQTGVGGFGLYNVQRKIEYLGGCFALESASGQGTRAAITVPLSIF